jgi:SAM-dependent methyltransferase
MGMEKGETRAMDFPAGRLRGAWREDRVLAATPAEFRPRRVAGREITPRLGRHYPLGMLSKPGIDRYDMRPFRITALEERALAADHNHALARYPLTVAVTALDIANKPSDVGGRAFAWMEELCDDGPGMQARVPGLATDFFGPDAFARPDEADDAAFYAAPRLVGHVDAQASAFIAAAYAPHLAPGARVLDLMSSFRSHLPSTAEGLDVTGLGLNAEELAANPALARRVVHDLNRDPALPFADAAFDAVLCSLSVEYLTDPLAVFAEVARVLRPGGWFGVSFSDRWFPPKVTRQWPDLHAFERMGFVLELFLRTTGFRDLETLSVRNWWRPEDDPHIRETWTSDPVYVVGGTRA